MHIFKLAPSRRHAEFLHLDLINPQHKSSQWCFRSQFFILDSFSTPASAFATCISQAISSLECRKSHCATSFCCGGIFPVLCKRKLRDCHGLELDYRGAPMLVHLDSEASISWSGSFWKPWICEFRCCTLKGFNDKRFNGVVWNYLYCLFFVRWLRRPDMQSSLAYETTHIDKLLLT